MIRRLWGYVTGDHHDHVAPLRDIQAPKNQPKPMTPDEIRKWLDA